MSFLTDLFDPGRREREAAAALTRGSTLRGGSASGGMGVGGGFTVGPDGRINMTGDMGQFGDIGSMLLGNAGGMFGGGTPDWMSQLFGGSFDSASDMLGNFEGGFGDIFNSALPTAMADPFQLGAETTDLLRQRAAPQQQRRAVGAVNQLFSRTRGAVGASNEAVARGLGEAEASEDLGFQLQGLETGRQLQGDAMGRVMSAFGGGQGAIQSRGGLADLLMRSTLQNQNLGFQSIGMASGLAQLPLAFQQAILQAQMARSNIGLGQAGSMTNIGNSARSPFLEALTAAGGFMSGLGSIGVGS